MPENELIPSTPLSQLGSSGSSVIEEIVRLRQPMSVVYGAVYAIAQIKGSVAPMPEPLQAAAALRQELMRLDSAELQRLLAEEHRKEEARQFYNARIPNAELAHWAQLDYWTVEESVALLLDRDPASVNWKQIKHRAYRSPFVQTYKRLLHVAERATALQDAQRLAPATVLAWAYDQSGVEPPSRLVDLVEARCGSVIRPRDPAPASAAAPDAVSPDAQRWTDARLEELRSYRNQHGTKAAAEHFGISQQRVRKLLPKSPKAQTGYSAFNRSGR